MSDSERSTNRPDNEHLYTEILKVVVSDAESMGL